MAAEQSGGAWVAAAIAAIPGAGTALWMAYKWATERGDKREEAHVTREMALQEQLDRERAAMTAEAARLFAIVTAENARKDARIQAMDDEISNLLNRRDALGDDMRAWKSVAHILKHEADNRATAVNALLHAMGRPARDWPDLELPPIGGVRPFLADIQRRLEAYHEDQGSPYRGQPISLKGPE